jgi:hypothetical protein
MILEVDVMAFQKNARNPRRDRLLTDAEIRKAKPRAAAYQMTDGRGLFLWVTPTGGKL